MKTNEIAPRSIEGDWDWRTIDSNVTDGWKTILEKPEKEHVWSFAADKTMVSREGDHILFEVEYDYDPDNMRLSLDGRRFFDEGKTDVPVEEYYRVEFASPAEMYLYDLDGVEVGNEEESLRLLLRKIEK
jgi:hypothetical protein